MSKLDDYIKEFGDVTEQYEAVQEGTDTKLKQQIKDLMLELIGKNEPITPDLKPSIVDQRLTRNQVKDYQRRKVELL